MGKYSVVSGQNLYDVALHIYGSVEGITDLLVNNPQLSMATELKGGQELIYTDDYLINADVAAYFRTHAITPVNGQRNVYFKETELERTAEIHLSPSHGVVSFSASGSGPLQVDWGDNTPLEDLALTKGTSIYAHSFDNKVAGTRKIRLYGDFRFRSLDISGLCPKGVYVYRPLTVEEFILHNAALPVDFLSMLSDTYLIDLSYTQAESLMPLVQCHGLMTLDLRGTVQSQSVLDHYFKALVERYYDRRPCRILLDCEPSGVYREPGRDAEGRYSIESGMEAVWVLVHEPAWNEGGSWHIIINDIEYTGEQNY